MVALAVVAVALPAVMMTLYQQVDGTAYLRDKSQAQMVAANKLAELRLLTRARQQLLRGSDSGTGEFAGRNWSWRIESSETEMQGFYRVAIEVRAAGDASAEAASERPLYTLVAFMHDAYAGERDGA